MLKSNIWPLSAYYPFELIQSRNEGKDVEICRSKIDEFNGLRQGDPLREKLAAEIMDELAAMPVIDGFTYREPADIDEIRTERPEFGRNLKYDIDSLTEEKLYDRIYGAWLGRCAGCLLGQPVEFWPRERFTGLLKDTGNYPVKYYISSAIDEEIRKKYNVSDMGWSYGCSVANWINNISYMPEDDDINYVILALKTLEEEGPAFTSEHVAGRWLMDLPLLHTFTAERIAYVNIANGIFPPMSARFRNPCREWIGAQIRGDFYGYINPGNPELAAEMAWRDAAVSHVKNGVYGEMFVSAMLSATSLTGDIEEIIRCGLSQIPVKSRLTEEINRVVSWKKSGIGWEKAIDMIHEKYDEKDEFEQIVVFPNAMVVCAGLIYGELDFEKSIGIALLGSYDKDCNCATVGSVVGMALGAKSLPEKWIKPLNNKVKSGVDGFGVVEISELAQRTVNVAKKVQKDLL